MEEGDFIIVDIHEGKIEDTVADMKQLLTILRKKYLKETIDSMSAKLGYKHSSLRNFEASKGEPFVGISLLKRICKSYNLKCELKIYK